MDSYEEIHNGTDKQSNYARLKSKLKIALKNEFWFEACMIEYAIIEDRTASILVHTGICKNAYDKELANKLNSIENQIGKKHPIISKKVKPDTISKIRDWKEKRNTIVHRVCRVKYEDSDIKEIALTGKAVMDEIDNAAKRISNVIKKEIRL